MLGCCSLVVFWNISLTPGWFLPAPSLFLASSIFLLSFLAFLFSSCVCFISHNLNISHSHFSSFSLLLLLTTSSSGHSSQSSSIPPSSAKSTTSPSSSLIRLLHIHSWPVCNLRVLCVSWPLLGWLLSVYRNVLLATSWLDPASPHWNSSSTFSLFWLPFLPSFLLLLLASPTHSSSALTTLGVQASFHTLSSHSESTTNLVSLQRLYMPFLLRTFPLM